jgi:hypothetical protein
MREIGIRDVLIYCADYKCSHSIEMNADQWPDRVSAHYEWGLSRDVIRFSALVAALIMGMLVAIDYNPREPK